MILVVSVKSSLRKDKKLLHIGISFMFGKVGIQE